MPLELSSSCSCPSPPASPSSSSRGCRLCSCMDYQVRSGRAKGLSKLLLLPGSLLCAHVAGSQQHKGTFMCSGYNKEDMKQHLYWLWKAGLAACSPSLVSCLIEQTAWTSPLRNRHRMLAGSITIPNFSSAFLQPGHFVGELFLFSC